MFHAFDPVTVRVSLDSKNIQHEKFVLQLVTPYIEGFSVPPLDEATDAQKRKLDEEEEIPKKAKKRQTKKKIRNQ